MEIPLPETTFHAWPHFLRNTVFLHIWEKNLEIPKWKFTFRPEFHRQKSGYCAQQLLSLRHL